MPSRGKKQNQDFWAFKHFCPLQPRKVARVYVKIWLLRIGGVRSVNSSSACSLPWKPRYYNIKPSWWKLKWDETLWLWRGCDAQQKRQGGCQVENMVLILASEKPAFIYLPISDECSWKNEWWKRTKGKFVLTGPRWVQYILLRCVHNRRSCWRSGVLPWRCVEQ